MDKKTKVIVLCWRPHFQAPTPPSVWSTIRTKRDNSAVYCNRPPSRCHSVICFASLVWSDGLDWEDEKLTKCHKIPTFINGLSVAKQRFEQIKIKSYFIWGSISPVGKRIILHQWLGCAPDQKNYQLTIFPPHVLSPFLHRRVLVNLGW